MKRKNKGQKGGTSPLPDPNAATVDSINLNPADPSVQAAKKQDKANDAADALVKHTKLEAEAAAFAEGFYQAGVTALQTIKTFVNENRETLKGIRYFFSHNKNKKVKETLCGCTTFEEYCEKVLHCDDHYVRQIFNSKVFALPEAAGGGNGEGDGDEGSETPPPPVSLVKLGNGAAQQAIDAIDAAAISDKDKYSVACSVLRQLEGYTKGLLKSITDSEKMLTVQPDAAVTENPDDEAQAAVA
jgi:hypothetical protein